MQARTQKGLYLEETKKRKWKFHLEAAVEDVCPKKGEHLQNVPLKTAQAFKSHVQLSTSQRGFYHV